MRDLEKPDEHVLEHAVARRRVLDALRLLVQLGWDGRDSAGEGSALGSVGAVIVLCGVWSVGAHGMVEQQA